MSAEQERRDEEQGDYVRISEKERGGEMERVRVCKSEVEGICVYQAVCL